MFWATLQPLADRRFATIFVCVLHHLEFVLVCTLHLGFVLIVDGFLAIFVFVDDGSRLVHFSHTYVNEAMGPLSTPCALSAAASQPLMDSLMGSIPPSSPALMMGHLSSHTMSERCLWLLCSSC